MLEIKTKANSPMFYKFFFFFDLEEFEIEGKVRKLRPSEKCLLASIYRAVEKDAMKNEVRFGERPACCSVAKSKLADMTGVTLPACFILVNNLCEAGLISRDDDFGMPHKFKMGRRKPIYITQKFLDLMDKKYPKYMKI